MAAKKKTVSKTITKAIEKAQKELAEVNAQMKTLVEASRNLYVNHARVLRAHAKLKKRAQVLKARIYNLKMKAKGRA
jgi:CII-binding regulator of phage lambda lysogenization HflD